MGIKVKGGMHCKRCGPVAGQKTTHRARGTVGLLGMLTLNPAALATPKVEDYHCPTCGGPAEPEWMTQARRMIEGNGRS